MSPRPIEFPVEGLADDAVRLRLPADADIPRLVEACQDPDVVRYTTVPLDYRDTHARGWMQRGMAGLATGTDVQTVITDLQGSDILGTMSLHELNFAAGRCAAGYLVASWARGRGVATRSLRLISGFAFEHLQLHRVELAIERQNVASRAAAAGAGFQAEGVLRSYMPVAGARRDMEMWSLLADEIRPPRRAQVATLEE